MNKTSSIICLSALWLMVTTAAAQQTEFPSAGQDPVIDDCTIEATDDIRLSAAEMGLLVHLSVKEGDRLEKDQEIGRVDDREAQAQRKVALHQLNAAAERAKDNVDLEYAQKAREVAEQEYKLLMETNRNAPNTVPLMDMERARLDAERSRLGEQKAAHDRVLAKYDYWTRRAEFEAAEMAIERRVIRAPFAGEVVELLRHQGEWLGSGEPLLRLVRLDTLYVEGDLNIGLVDPRKVQGCKVTVEAIAGGGRTVQATGRVVKIHPVIAWDGRHLRKVRAEIANSLENEDWKIHPGAYAKMTIHLETGKVNVSQIQNRR